MKELKLAPESGRSGLDYGVVKSFEILLWLLLVWLIFKVTEGYPCVTYVYFCVFFFYFCVFCLCVFSLYVFCFLHRHGLCISVLVWQKYWPIRIIRTSMSKDSHSVSILDFWYTWILSWLNSIWTHSGHFWTFSGHFLPNSFCVYFTWQFWMKHNTILY